MFSIASAADVAPEVLVLKEKVPEEKYAYEEYKFDKKSSKSFSFDQPEFLQTIAISDDNTPIDRTPAMLGSGVLGEKKSYGIAFFGISSEFESNQVSTIVGTVKIDEPNGNTNVLKQYYQPNIITNSWFTGEPNGNINVIKQYHQPNITTNSWFTK
jgi:hypothetical protein